MVAAAAKVLTDSARWKLDVVGVLAVLGERNIRLSATLITSTALCYLPRLLPAPQALLSITGDRIKRLPAETNVSVCAVYSGNKLDSLDFFAVLLHQKFLNAPAFTTQRVEISPKSHEYSDLSVRRRSLGPINAITMLSCMGAAGLMVYAARIEDWVGLSAVLIMSVTSSMVSAAYHWIPRLPNRNAPRAEGTLPAGDLVVKTAKGSFLVVHCQESIARKLYFNQEDCVYTFDERWSRAIGGFAGGVLIVIAVILFWNCSWQIQWGAALSYGVLNIAYWAATICPVSWTWSFDDFTLLPKEPVSHTTYTGALAEAIRLVGHTQWAKLMGAAPRTPAWDKWLDRAQKALTDNDDEWFVDRKGQNYVDQASTTHFQGALTYYLKHPQEV